MASFIGNEVTIEVMTTAGGTTLDFAFTAFARGAAIDETVDAVEATHYGQTAKGFVAGLSEGTFAFTIDHDNGTLADSPQKNLRDIHRLTRAWRVRPLGAGAGKQEYTFDGFVTNSPIALGHDELVATDVEVQITGAITHATQS